VSVVLGCYICGFLTVGLRTDILARTDPDSARVRAMMKGYDLHELGPDKETWSDVVIYIRESEVATIPSQDGTF
jgi:hypothetical protein